MDQPPIPISKPNITAADIETVVETLNSGWIVQGPQVDRFERMWSEFTNIPNCAAVTSCTSGLSLAIQALAIKPGDEVIVPAFTWVATANAVQLAGAKVVFCDISPETFNLDLGSLREKISARTKAIMVVHLFGLSADMTAIKDLTKNRNIKIIEDAACGFGAFFNGHHVGALGDISVFSFHPRKAITTGEGGMVCSNDEDLIRQVKAMRDHGSHISDKTRHDSSKPYQLADHEVLGSNARMTDIQAALGCSQMRRANQILDHRREIAQFYSSDLQAVSWLKLPLVLDDRFIHGYQSYVCMVREHSTCHEDLSTRIDLINKQHILRNQLMEFLQKNLISTRPGTHSITTLSFFKNLYKLKSEDFIGAFEAHNCSISLPIYSGMHREEVHLVTKLIKGFAV